MNLPVIRTSEKGWLVKLAEAYKNRTPARLIDDAEVGVDPSGQSLLDMGRKANLSFADWTAAVAALGVSGVGAVMIVLSFFDPEPTSKLGLLIGGGTVCVLTGGFLAIRVLTTYKPPSVHVGTDGIDIRWE